MNLVSVVIPCYKQAKFLGEAIESVLGQTNRDFEVIVVNDGSPDRPDEVVNRYPGVRYVAQKNQGVARARNKGIHESRGDYIVFLDADDRLLPNNLQIGLEAFRQRPHISRVDGAYRAFTSEGTWYGHNCNYQLDQYGTLLRAGQQLSTVMWRRDVLQRLGGFRDLKRFQDHDLHVRFAQSYTLYCHHQLVSEHREYHKPIHWDQELQYSMMMCRLQRSYIKRHPQYKDLYRFVISDFQHRYGDPLLWELGVAVRAREWRLAFRYLWVLVRFYPTGLASHYHQVIRRQLSLASQAVGPSSTG